MIGRKTEENLRELLVSPQPFWAKQNHIIRHNSGKALLQYLIFWH